MITKTDFIEYLDAPKHMWALQQGEIEIPPSPLSLHLMEGGKKIEKLAREFIKDYLLKDIEAEISFEETFLDGNFQIRADAVARYPNEGVMDIYEIKSASSVRKADQYDVTFQQLVCEASENTRDFYLIHLNKDYTRQGELDLGKLFVAEKLNEEIDSLRNEVKGSREDSWEVSNQNNPDRVEGCQNPKTCPCPSLCHPNLPQYSIYDIPRLNRKKKLELRSQGVSSIQDIPDGYPLSDIQNLHVASIKRGKKLIDTGAIQVELGKLEYPLNFLDYETYNPGIPFFDGYKPWQHIVYQYSLHIFRNPGDEPEHHELLITEEGDPGQRFIKNLKEHITPSGSVIVWNRPFEAGRNTELAERYPEYREFLLDVNERIFDLMEIFQKGYYVHPDFKGSASIKNVLPVLVPEFEGEYEKLGISSGEETMLVWAGIHMGEIPIDQLERIRRDMLAYCKLDTLAMVKIWEKLR